ncbi:DNA/RNA polymerase [Biscogniauxia mediterranea]|nr:DNA/RNA polymerase [Biscogniauxia mediterranea]
MKTATLTSAKPGATKPPKRNDDRVILHFDYDCFYASVFENENPALKSLPLGVKQKSILATCNYVARARGVRKLMLVSDAQRVCPDLVVLNGEDLTRFRDVSKRLWSALRAHSWNRRVERLGLDEVFLDVTDVVAYNAEMLNVRALRHSFFHLDRRDPEKGFAFDGTRFFGCVYPPAAANPTAEAKGADSAKVLPEDPLSVRLMLASHLAGYLRHKLEEDFGYTSSGGVSTSKVLAKLAGSVNKPKNQTTLLSIQESDVQAFMDAHQIRKIPGIGSRIAQLIQDHVLLSITPTSISNATTQPQSHPRETAGIGAEGSLTVKQVRQHPGMCPELLERILSRPGSERGSGEKVWGLLHGVDRTEVKPASDVPAQISVEDTYMARPLGTAAEVARELRALSASLVRRMRVDLMDPRPGARCSWLAYPKTLRLSTRTRPKPGSNNSSSSSDAAHHAFSRTSRSTALPRFALHLPDSTTTTTITDDADDDVDGIAARLVAETLLPLFRRLHPEPRPPQGLNLALINICVTNMVTVAPGGGGQGGSGGGSGRDIGSMFRTQEDKLREFTVYDTSSSDSHGYGHDSTTTTTTTTTITAHDSSHRGDGDGSGGGSDDDDVGSGPGSPLQLGGGGGDSDVPLDSGMATTEPAAVLLPDDDEADAWDDEGVVEEEEDSFRYCPLCGHPIPYFAAAAHERFHSMGDC